MSNPDNHDDNESLMSTFYESKKIYDIRPNKTLKPCLCNAMKNDWEPVAPTGAKRENLIAYIRAQNREDLTKYLDELNRYCSENQFNIVQTFTDVGDRPSFGLQAAFAALDNTDGLIASEIKMFIKDNADVIRELRPFIHHFFCQIQKHLITILDGIDTGTSMGQENAISLICENKVCFNT